MHHAAHHLHLPGSTAGASRLASCRERKARPSRRLSRRHRSPAFVPSTSARCRSARRYCSARSCSVRPRTHEHGGSHDTRQPNARRVHELPTITSASHSPFAALFTSMPMRATPGGAPPRVGATTRPSSDVGPFAARPPDRSPPYLSLSPVASMYEVTT